MLLFYIIAGIDRKIVKKVTKQIVHTNLPFTTCIFYVK